MASDNVEFMRRGYAAANRVIATGDVASVVSEFYDPGAQYESVEEGEIARGHLEIVAYFERFLEVWDDLRWDVEEILEAGDRVMATILLTGQAQGSGMTVAQRIFQVVDIRGRKIVRVREFVERDDALEAMRLATS